MATGAKNGLHPSRKIGSAPDNQGLVEYNIASGYATSLFQGDLLKLASDGTVERGTNGDTIIGVFMGCSYVDTSGIPQEAAYFPANTTGDNITAKVKVDDNEKFKGKAEGTMTGVNVGDQFEVSYLISGDTKFGLSGLQIRTNATTVGDVDLSAVTDLGADTAVSDTDAFVVEGTTVTISDGDSPTDLLDALNAISNVSASLTEDGFLKVSATDGGTLVISESTGTPAADLGLNVGTTAVASNAVVEVTNILDQDNKVLEVKIV